MVKRGCVERGLFVGKNEAVVEGSKEGRATSSRVDEAGTIDISL